MKEIIPDWPHKSPLTKRCDVCKLYPQAAPNINEKERCKCRQKEEQPAPEELDAGEWMHENYSGFYHEFDEQQIRDILESMESFAQASITVREAAWLKEKRELVAELDRRRNLLEDVINELDLSQAAIEKHGPIGTEPSVLVKLVLEEKDRVIRNLRNGLKEINPKTHQ